MKKITALLLAAMFVLSPMTVFAASPQTPQDMPKVPETQLPEMPKMSDNVPLPVVGPGIMGRTVVATSDGGIVIVTGNKVSKFDKNLKITKTIELSND